MENLAKEYREQLDNSTNPGVLLENFFSKLFEIELDTKRIMIFYRLVRIYGRYIVFYSILDIAGMKDPKLDNISGLLTYFCKKRFEAVETKVILVDIKEIQKKIDSIKSKKRKVGNPFNE